MIKFTFILGLSLVAVISYSVIVINSKTMQIKHLERTVNYHKHMSDSLNEEMSKILLDKAYLQYTLDTLENNEIK